MGMASANSFRPYAANNLRASKSDHTFVSGKQPSEFTMLRETGRRLFPDGMIRSKDNDQRETTGEMAFEKSEALKK